MRKPPAFGTPEHKAYVDRIQDRFRPGMRLRLIHMNEEERPVPDGTIGVVDFVDDAGTVFMKWDNGSGLGLRPDVDEFEVIDQAE
jgi:hypothetical protein